MQSFQSYLNEEVAAVLFESLLFGALLVVFCTGTYLRFSIYKPDGRGTWRRYRHIVPPTSFAILVLATAHYIIAVHGLFSAPLGSGSAAEIIETIFIKRKDLAIVSGALITATMLVGDAVLIHRLWVAWSRSKLVVVPPILMWTGLLATGTMVTYKFVRSDLSNQWIKWNWALSVVTNAYCTGLISWRIWRTCRTGERAAARPLNSVLAVLVESAAIWTAWVVFFGITAARDSGVGLLASAAIPSVLGITNTLIHIRVALAARVHAHAHSRQGPTGQFAITMTNDASMAIGTSYGYTTETMSASAECECCNGQNSYPPTPGQQGQIPISNLGPHIHLDGRCIKVP